MNPNNEATEQMMQLYQQEHDPEYQDEKRRKVKRDKLKKEKAEDYGI